MFCIGSFWWHDRLCRPCHRSLPDISLPVITVQTSTRARAPGIEMSSLGHREAGHADSECAFMSRRGRGKGFRTLPSSFTGDGSQCCLKRYSAVHKPDPGPLPTVPSCRSSGNLTLSDARISISVSVRWMSTPQELAEDFIARGLKVSRAWLQRRPGEEGTGSPGRCGSRQTGRQQSFSR